MGCPQGTKQKPYPPICVMKNEELSSISNLQNASVPLISLYLYLSLPFRLTECLWKMSTTNLNNHILTAVAAKIEQRKQRKCIDFQVLRKFM